MGALRPIPLVPLDEIRKRALGLGGSIAVAQRALFDARQVAWQLLVDAASTRLQKPSEVDTADGTRFMDPKVLHLVDKAMAAADRNEEAALRYVLEDDSFGALMAPEETEEDITW